MVKNLPATQEMWVPSLGREDPLEKGWQPTPAFLPGKPHGQRSLSGYSHGAAKTWQNRVTNTLTQFNTYILNFFPVFLLIQVLSSQDDTGIKSLKKKVPDKQNLRKDRSLSFLGCRGQQRSRLRKKGQASLQYSSRKVILSAVRHDLATEPEQEDYFTWDSAK